MAHEVESMFAVGETPWHGLGKMLQDHPTIPEALKQAGLDWEVTTEPITRKGVALPHIGQLVVRSSDDKVLGKVGPNWHPLQNRRAFGWFEPFIDSGLCDLETAGSLRGGAVVWVLAKIRDNPDMEISKADPVRKYLLLSNSHDGSQAIRVGFSPIRVVCMNTLSMSHRDKGSKLLRIKHTAGLHTSLKEVRDTINLVSKQFEATAEQYRRLAQRRINKTDLRMYVVRVIAKSPEKPTKQEWGKIETCVALALEGKGNADQPLTLWTAYNGVTEYLTWAAGRENSTRLDSLWFGKGGAVNDEALNIALSLSA